MRKRIITILTLLTIAVLTFTACERLFAPSNPYGNGSGDITIMGASRIGLHFRRIGTVDDDRIVDDIDGIKIWHQRSDEGGWIEHTTVWIGNFNAFVEFSDRTFIICCCCRGDCLCIIIYCNWQCDDRKNNLLNTFSKIFFENYNLVLVGMMEGVLTTGIRVDRVNDNGIVDITRTRFNDRSSIALGIPLHLSIPVDKDFIPYTMSVNMQTNYVRRN